MALLDRSDWYNLGRATNWTPRYVTEEELFPDDMSDKFGLSSDQWEAFDEPYKVSYRGYVDIQSTKDAEAYSVRAVLARSNFYDQADKGWQAILRLHFGAVCLPEYTAVVGESKMARFGKASGWRNMATLGCLDEIRHTQMQLFFAHAYTEKSRQFDFAHRMLHTNGWAPVASRLALDDTIQSRDAATMAIMLTFATEQGFTKCAISRAGRRRGKCGGLQFLQYVLQRTDRRSAPFADWCRRDEGADREWQKSGGAARR